MKPRRPELLLADGPPFDSASSASTLGPIFSETGPARPDLAPHRLGPLHSRTVTREILNTRATCRCIRLPPTPCDDDMHLIHPEYPLQRTRKAGSSASPPSGSQVDHFPNGVPTTSIAGVNASAVVSQLTVCLAKIATGPKTLTLASARHSTKRCDLLLEGDIAAAFFDAVVDQARQADLLSDEHFTVDGTLLEAWASLKSFRRKDEETTAPPDDPGNPTVDFHGESRRNDTHQSTTDPEARLARKGNGKEAKLSYAGHVLLDNRHGLVANVCVKALGATRRSTFRDLA
jgi:hypothetical protein